jgi:outer membrane protein insertion porin family
MGQVNSRLVSLKFAPPSMFSLKPFRFLAIGLSMVVVSPGGQAQEAGVPVNAPAAGRTVKSLRVVFKGPVSMSEARVRAQMATREGEAFTDENVEQDIRNLYATGAVDNVDIAASDVAGGVAVTVTVTGRGALGQVRFVGNTAYPQDRLLKETELRVGEPVDEAKLATGQQKIRELYEKKGFSGIAVNYSTEPTTDGFTRVTYTIGEGARGLVRNINFEGNSAIKSSVLRSKLKLKEKAIYRVWRGKSKTITDEVLFEDRKAVESTYQDEGYVYAQVLDIRRDQVDEKYVDLTYVITEGDRYDVAEVAMDGLTIFTPEELGPALQTIAGFPYSGSEVRADEKMIGDYYGSRGYADARVDTSIVPAGPNQVKVVYRVTEGDKSFVRKVNIAGNSTTQDRVIRRELPFTPGEEVNTVKMEAGRNRLQNLGYFSAVDMRTNDTEQPGFKDVDVTVTEQSTGTVNFGAGFSSIDALVGFLDLTQTNFNIGGNGFRGAGQRFNLGLKYGTERRDFQMSFTEPWFLGQKLAFTTELFYRDLFYLSDVFDQSNVGGSLNFRKPLGEHSYAELTYTLQQIGVDVAEEASEIIQQEDGDYLQSKIDLSWVHDTRDSVFLTRKGHKVEIGALVSGSFLGGDADVWGINLQATQFFNLPFDTILSIEGAFRTVDTLGSGDRVPIFERLFLGGANNLRGFDFREVGPKDETGEPVGGLSSAHAAVEYTFPIVEKVRGAVFYDIGMVSDSSFDWGGDINSNFGVGLRLFLPIGPIRVDFGVPVQSDEFNDSSGQFHFNVGYKF